MILNGHDWNITCIIFSITESYCDALINFVSQDRRQGIFSGFWLAAFEFVKTTWTRPVRLRPMASSHLTPELPNECPNSLFIRLCVESDVAWRLGRIKKRGSLNVLRVIYLYQEISSKSVNHTAGWLATRNIPLIWRNQPLHLIAIWTRHLYSDINLPRNDWVQGAE